jgi:hypothetical protein
MSVEQVEPVDQNILPARKKKPIGWNRVTFTEAADGRLLALIRNSTFICHRQLIKLGLLLGYKSKRQNIERRVNRYLQFNLIQTFPPIAPYSGMVYQITTGGLNLLDSYGLGICSISSETKTFPSILQAPHFLALNEIRIAFRADSSLGYADWITDPEIKSRNTAPNVIAFAKDYDALLKLKDKAGQDVLIGIEYERTYKDKARYDEVSRNLNTEQQICCVLYIVASYELLTRLIEAINCPDFPVCITASGVLKDKLLDVSVGYMTPAGRKFTTLRQYLGMQNHPM